MQAMVGGKQVTEKAFKPSSPAKKRYGMQWNAPEHWIVSTIVEMVLQL